MTVADAPIETAVDIPFVDLASQHAEIAVEVEAGFAAVMRSTSFIGGATVAAFEEQLATWWGRSHAVGVANGTDAIELMLRAAGIGGGDEVILPANTFIATASAVARTGARPVFADVDRAHLLIDPEQLAQRITPRTRGVIAVHLYGQMAPMEQLSQVLEDRPILLFEDAAQAHGARRHGLSSGSLGLAAATSFYPGKNLGAYGDGGAVLSDRDELARRVRLIANHGASNKYDHEVLGFNSRLDALQAVVLQAKLRRLEGWNRARAQVAARYDELLADFSPLWLPQTMAGNEHVWHLYTVRLEERDRLLAGLTRRGVGAGIHYPMPLHLVGAFSDLGYRPGDFPNAEEAAARLLSLPMHPHLGVGQQECIAEIIHEELA